MKRRGFLATGVAAVGALATRAEAQSPLDPLVKSQSDPKRRILLRGGMVLSLDPLSVISKKRTY